MNWVVYPAQPGWLEAWVQHTLSLAARVPVSLHLPTLSQLPLSISSHCRRGVPQALSGLRSQI